MKKRLLWGIILMAGLSGMYACNEEYASPENEESGTAGLNEQFLRDRAVIEAMGFDVSDLVDAGEDYLVESDLLIEKEDLVDSIATRHQILKNRTIDWDGTKKTFTVSYWGADSVRTNAWKKSLKEAVKAWNTIPGFAIELKWAEYNGNIAFSDNVGYTVGAARSPKNGDPGSSIYIHPNSPLASDKKKQAAVHLLGHALGFYHTDNPKLGIGDVIYVDLIDDGTPEVIPGTGGESTYDSNPDPFSVMNTKALTNDWSDFSALDKRAFAIQYPLATKVIPSTVKASITQVQSGNVIRQHENLEFKLSCNTEGYTLTNVTWTGGKPQGSTSAGTVLKFEKPGLQYVVATGKISRPTYVTRNFETNALPVYVISTEIPVITTPEGTVYAEEEYEFTLDYKTALDARQYIWEVEDGEVVSQSGNKAVVKFNTTGRKRVRSYVIQRSGGTEYPSETGEYYVEVKKSRLTLPSRAPRIFNLTMEQFDRADLTVDWCWNELSSISDYEYHWGYPSIGQFIVQNNITSLKLWPQTNGNFPVSLRIRGKYNNYDSGLISCSVKVNIPDFDRYSPFAVDIRYDPTTRTFKDTDNQTSYDGVSLGEMISKYHFSTGQYEYYLKGLNVRHQKGLLMISEDMLGDISWDLRSDIYLEELSHYDIQKNVFVYMEDSYRSICEFSVLWNKYTNKVYLTYLGHGNAGGEREEYTFEMAKEIGHPYGQKIRFFISADNTGIHWGIEEYAQVFTPVTIFPFYATIDEDEDGGVSRIYNFSLSRYD